MVLMRNSCFCAVRRVDTMRCLTKSPTSGLESRISFNSCRVYRLLVVSGKPDWMGVKRVMVLNDTFLAQYRKARETWRKVRRKWTSASEVMSSWSIISSISSGMCIDDGEAPSDMAVVCDKLQRCSSAR
jgi:hypothetical protein